MAQTLYAYRAKFLTVAELQEKLSEFRSDMPVVFRDADGCVHAVEQGHGETMSLRRVREDVADLAVFMLSTRQTI